MSAVAGVLLIVLVAADLLGVLWLFAVLSYHPAPVLRPLSLRSQARSLLLGDRRRDRLARRWQELRQRVPIIRAAPFVLLVLAAFAPEVLGFLSNPDGTFSHPSAATDFLQTLWQVVAGALGLSVAMIAFAFEAFVSTSQRRLGGTLREFAAETKLLAAIQLGVTALLIDGMVLLGIGSEAPAGWAGAWATTVSALTLLGVVYVLSQVVRSLDFGELVRMRRARLEATVQEAMWHQLTGQAAEAVLRGHERVGVDRAWFKPDGARTLQSVAPGQLRDVWLGSLLRLARGVKKRGRSPRFGLMIGLGEQFDAEADLLAIDAQATPREIRRARRALRIGKKTQLAPDRGLNEQLSRLHGQAMIAAREGRTEDWREIGALYELVLLALPRAAKRIGVPFEGAIAAPGPFGFGPVQRIADHLSDELEVALEAGHAETVGAISYVPTVVARESLSAEAVRVAIEMVRTYPRAYWLARRMPEPRSRSAERLLDRAVGDLVDLDYLIEGPFLDPPGPEERRAEAAAFGRSLFLQLNAILKFCLDSSDGQGFAEVERKWARMLEGEIPFQPEAAANPDTLVGLDRYRSVLRFGLAMWATHLLAQGGEQGQGKQDPRAEALRLLAGRFNQVEEILDVFERAERRDEEESVPWTTWFLGELPEDEAHMIPTSGELLFTALLLIVARVDADTELRPRELFEWRRSDIDDALTRLREESARWSSVLEPIGGSETPGDAENTEQAWLTRVELLEASLATAREGAVAYREAAEREASLDPKIVEEFSSQLIKATKEGRVIRDLFAAQGALHSQADQGERERLVSQMWLPKRLFIAGSNLIGADRSGRDLARATRNAEMRQLLDALEGVDIEEVGEEVATRLRELVEEMAGTESPATLLLLPISWHLRESLGLAMWGGQTVDSDLVPARRRGEFAGLFEGVPALDSPHVPSDRLYLVNLPSVGTFVEWPSDQGSGIELRVESFDAAAAARLLAEHPEVRPQGSSDEEAVRTLQERVLCSQFLQWRIEAGEEPLGRCLIVPEDLRR